MVSWTSQNYVRAIAGVSTTDYSDAMIEDFISTAQKEVNSKVLVKIIREPIVFLDQYRQNDIDGTNTTFFVRNWKGNWFADSNYDNVVDINDLKVVQYDPNTTLETELTISSIDIKNMSFTLSVAPANNVQLYVDYCYTPFDMINPDPFLTQATTYLAASYLFIGTDGFKITFGNVTIEPGKDGGQGKQLYSQYERLLQQINILGTGGAIVGEMTPINAIYGSTWSNYGGPVYGPYVYKQVN